MSKGGPDVLRYVPTESCARCGATVEDDRRAFVLADRVSENGETESGNLCADCFDHLLADIEA